MTDIAAARANIQQEAVQYRSALSESILSTVGGSINFVNNKQYDTKDFFINGPYNITGVNETFVDGLQVIPVGINIQIFDVAMFNIVAGSAGTTTLDVLYTTASGTASGSWTSIFSTKPAIATTAGNNAYVQTGGSGTGLTAPVLTTPAGITLAAGDAFRVDFTGKQTGSPQNCGLIIFYKPVN